MSTAALSLLAVACSSTSSENESTTTTPVTAEVNAPDGDGGAISMPGDTSVDSSATVTSTDPVVITATATGDAVEVVALADSTDETVLTATSEGVTFTVRIPSGALPNDLRFTVTPAVTSTGEPAMLVEPSGLALLKPARISATGTSARLVAWGPTGVARLLPEADDDDGSTPIVVLGGVAPARDEGQQSAAGAASGSDVDQWAQGEEQDEAENPDGSYDDERRTTTAGAIGSGPVCKPGDRAAALEALAAVRAGAALGGKPAPAPACLDVSVKVTIGLAGQAQLNGGTIQIDEVMSGAGRLAPTETGHAGDVELAVDKLVVGCTARSTTSEILGIEATWSGDNLAQLSITPKRIGTLDYLCGNGVRADGIEMMSGVLLQGLSDLTGGTMIVKAPITEGSFYIFSLLESTEQVKEWRVAGREWQSAVSGANARFTFTVDVVYSAPSE